MDTWRRDSYGLPIQWLVMDHAPDNTAYYARIDILYAGFSVFTFSFATILGIAAFSGRLRTQVVKMSRFCVLIFLVHSGFAQSPTNTEEALKAAQTKLDACLKQACASLDAGGRQDLRAELQQSQKAWEEYRDSAAAFEMGDVKSDSDIGKKEYAATLLRMTNERIETLEIPFNHELCNPSDVRIRNGSNVDFKNVVVGSTNYGDIKSGASTAYQRWGTAYSYAYVSLISGTKPLIIQPTDFVGEPPLGEGKFTYVLSLDGSNLEIQAVKDTK